MRPGVSRKAIAVGTGVLAATAIAVTSPKFVGPAIERIKISMHIRNRQVLLPPGLKRAAREFGSFGHEKEAEEFFRETEEWARREMIRKRATCFLVGWNELRQIYLNLTKKRADFATLEIRKRIKGKNFSKEEAKQIMRASKELQVLFNKMIREGKLPSQKEIMNFIRREIDPVIRNHDSRENTQERPKKENWKNRKQNRESPPISIALKK